jgi:predicted RNase H-like HicB family nuclease
MRMDFYTIVLKKSASYWVALCLENGCVGQGSSRESAIENLKDAIDSMMEAKKTDPDIDSEPLSIKELHEFLTVEAPLPVTMPLEMRTLYA